jgi:hypothetical protein
MKFEAVQRAVWGYKNIDPMDKQWVQGEIRGAKWLVWHTARAARQCRGSRHWTIA